MFNGLYSPYRWQPWWNSGSTHLQPQRGFSCWQQPLLSCTSPSAASLLSSLPASSVWWRKFMFPGAVTILSVFPSVFSRFMKYSVGFGLVCVGQETLPSENELSSLNKGDSSFFISIVFATVMIRESVCMWAFTFTACSILSVFGGRMSGDVFLKLLPIQSNTQLVHTYCNSQPVSKYTQSMY